MTDLLNAKTAEKTKSVIKLGKLIIALIALLFIFGLTSVSAMADESKAAGTSTEYRTKADIVQYMASHPSGYKTDDSSLYAGSESEERRAALNMVKTARYIAGIPDDISISDLCNSYAQQAVDACVSAGEVSHYLGSYTNSCNLGRVNRENYSLRWFVLDGWLEDDGDNNQGILGHRRWLLNPKMVSTGFGYKSSGGYTYASMYVKSTTDTATGYYGVMWPSRTMPVMYFTPESAWSYSFGTPLAKSSSGSSDEDICVILTDNNTQKVWYFDKYNTESGYFTVNDGNFGTSGCVIWEPKGIDGYKDGDSYHVSINYISTGEIIADYNVDFFDSETYLAPETFQFLDLSLNEEGYPTLVWTESADADHYKIYRQSVNSGKWVCLEESLPAYSIGSDVMEYTDETVGKGIEYIYKVIAVKEVDNVYYERSADSFEQNEASLSERKVSTALSEKGAVITTYKAYSKKTNLLKWKKVSYATGYKIYRRVYGSSKWTLMKTTTSSSTLSWKDTKAVSGKKYQYRIRAYRKNYGNYVYAPYSSVKTVKTK